MLRPVLFLCLTISVCYGVPSNSDESSEIKSKQTVHHHHKTGAKWTAAPNKSLQSNAAFQTRLGARKEGAARRNSARPTISHDLSNSVIPETFDARKVWSHCMTVTQIRDQSSCGSCWAFGAAEAISDRLCIHSCGLIQKEISATNLVACCKSCGSGCYGGWPGLAWDYWKNSGLVSGGSLEHPDGCMNYPFPSCNHHGHGSKEPCPEELYRTPKCVQECDSKYNKTFADDLSQGYSSYNIPSDEEQIKMEIMTNGPVEVAFDVYEDFETYTSGIYFHAWGKLLGGHAVKMLGWGVEDGVPYWLLANSWNKDWGEKGYFRILRGNDECGIESEVVAGMPLDPSTTKSVC